MSHSHASTCQVCPIWACGSVQCTGERLGEAPRRTHQKGKKCSEGGCSVEPHGNDQRGLALGDGANRKEGERCEYGRQYGQHHPCTDPTLFSALQRPCRPGMKPENRTRLLRAGSALCMWRASIGKLKHARCLHQEGTRCSCHMCAHLQSACATTAARQR